MTPAELEMYLHLTDAIARHSQSLEEAVKAKQELARSLYERYGRDAVYRIGEGEEQRDRMIARTKTDTFYFAPRVRYPKESRYGKAEQKRLDRAARMALFPTQASVRPPSVEEMNAAAEQGRHDRDRATAKRAAQIKPFDPVHAKLRLPIVGDVDQPRPPVEPRLLEIQEPSGNLVDDPDA